MTSPDLQAPITNLLAASRKNPGSTDEDVARSIMQNAVEPELAKRCTHTLDMDGLGEFEISTVMRVLRSVGIRLAIDVDRTDHG